MRRGYRFLFLLNKLFYFVIVLLFFNFLFGLAIVRFIFLLLLICILVGLFLIFYLGRRVLFRVAKPHFTKYTGTKEQTDKFGTARKNSRSKDQVIDVEAEIIEDNQDNGDR
ncbi:MAG: hypothetical protein DRP78_03715 [Candidatus Omnitrophota bacterium]|nr:MAG: hypothetical protein DRP78_03715 [Candidatus Omnitrophota bacterium]